MFNSFLSAFPASNYMIAERDIDLDFQGYGSKQKYYIELIPEIYKETMTNDYFSNINLVGYMLLGCLHSLVIFFVPMVCWELNFIDEFGRVLY